MEPFDRCILLMFCSYKIRYLYFGQAYVSNFVQLRVATQHVTQNLFDSTCQPDWNDITKMLVPTRRVLSKVAIIRNNTQKHQVAEYMKKHKKMLVTRDRTTDTFIDFLTLGKSNPQARTTELQGTSMVHGSAGSMINKV